MNFNLVIMPIIKKYYFLHVVFPLITGILIYALLRHIYLIDPSGEYFPMIYYPHCPDWIKYNVPDGLWLYAFLSMLSSIWNRTFSLSFIIWCIAAILSSYLSEFAQIVYLLPGTFDWKDIIAYTISTIIFLLINYNSPIIN